MGGASTSARSTGLLGSVHSGGAGVCPPQTGSLPPLPLAKLTSSACGVLPTFPAAISWPTSLGVITHAPVDLHGCDLAAAADLQDLRGDADRGPIADTRH